MTPSNDTKGEEEDMDSLHVIPLQYLSIIIVIVTFPVHIVHKGASFPLFTVLMRGGSHRCVICVNCVYIFCGFCCAVWILGVLST